MVGFHLHHHACSSHAGSHHPVVTVQSKTARARSSRGTRSECAAARAGARSGCASRRCCLIGSGVCGPSAALLLGHGQIKSTVKDRASRHEFTKPKASAASKQRRRPTPRRNRREVLLLAEGQGIWPAGYSAIPDGALIDLISVPVEFSEQSDRLSLGHETGGSSPLLGT